MASHYSVLGVHETATYGEIKAAFHKLARRSHPDKQQQRILSKNNDGDVAAANDNDSDCHLNNNDNAEQDFKAIHKAWETLRDVNLRSKYDEELQQTKAKHKSKQHGAIVIERHELETAVDDETGETIYVYDCRCGEEVIVEEQHRNENEAVMIDCPGCCFVYKIVTS